MRRWEETFVIKSAAETLKKQWREEFHIKGLESVTWFMRTSKNPETDVGFWVGYQKNRNNENAGPSIASCMVKCSMQIGEESPGIIRETKFTTEEAWGPPKGWITFEKIKQAVDFDGNLTIQLELHISDIEFCKTTGPLVFGNNKMIEPHKEAHVRFQHDRIAASFGKPGGDVTLLLANEKEMTVHGQIIAAQSDVFHAMLSRHSCVEKANRTIDMKAYPATVVELFIKYLYTSDIEVFQKSIMTMEERIVLYKMAEMYEIPPLLTFAVSHLGSGARQALINRDFVGFHHVMQFLKNLRPGHFGSLSLLTDVRNTFFDTTLKPQAFDYIINYT